MLFEGMPDREWKEGEKRVRGSTGSAGHWLVPGGRGLASKAGRGMPPWTAARLLDVLQTSPIDSAPPYLRRFSVQVSKMVFIGKELDRQLIEEGFRECLVK